MSKGLEAIEQYKKVICPNCQYNYGDGCQNKDQCFSMIIEKELKALEIIKKLTNIGTFINYNLDSLSQKEYDLLKEVLL